MSKPPDVDRRGFVGVAAATVAAGPLGLFDLSRRVNAMTQALTDVGNRGRVMGPTFARFVSRPRMPI